MGAVTCRKLEALVTAETIGLEPIVNVAVPVGEEQEVPFGLQTPSTTVPPGPVGPKGRLADAVVGTVIVSTMLETFTTLTVMDGSTTKPPEVTTPTFVRSAGSVPATKPEPVIAIVNDWPAAAVGRLAGVNDVIAAPGACTLTLNVTVIVVEGVPDVIATVPTSVVPGCAEANRFGLNVTGIGVPKLYAKPFRLAAGITGANVPPVSIV